MLEGLVEVAGGRAGSPKREVVPRIPVRVWEDENGTTQITSKAPQLHLLDTLKKNPQNALKHYALEVSP